MRVYNPYTQDAMLEVMVTCSDGRQGSARVIRYGPNLISGSGNGKLDDGTEFKVLLGEAVHQGAALGFWEK